MEWQRYCIWMGEALQIEWKGIGIWMGEVQQMNGRGIGRLMGEVQVDECERFRGQMRELLQIDGKVKGKKWKVFINGLKSYWYWRVIGYVRGFEESLLFDGRVIVDGWERYSRCMMTHIQI